MSDNIVDLTHSLQSGNSGNENSPEAIVIQTLGKFDVDFEDFRKEVNILDFRIIKSQENDRNSVFAEFESVSYKILFTTYNVEFFVRLLSFQNDIQCQILKLDIELKTTNIKKEIEYCLNSLQRRRNLNLMFKTLIEFGKLIESRRLICDLILKKNHKVKIEQNKDGGIIVVYSDEPRNVGLGVFWSIACSSTHDVTDVIEVYYKVVELPFKMDIKYTLNKLTKPCLDFSKKYHLWKSLIDDLSERTLIIKIDKMSNDTTTHKEAQPITILSDSEDPFEKTLVTDVDKIPNESIIKDPEGRPSLNNSNIKESARSIVEADIMPDSSTTKDVISKCHELQDQTVTVLSDSEDTFVKTLVTDVDKVRSESIIKNPERQPSSKTRNIKESARSLVVKIDIMPDSSTTKDVITKCHEIQDQTVTVISDSEEYTRRSLIVDKKLDNSTGSHGITQEVQNLEEISRKSVVVVVDKKPATSSTDSHNEARTCTEHSNGNTKDGDTDVLTYLQLKQNSNKEKLKDEYDNFIIKRPLRTRIRQTSKNKGAELESSDSSNSEQTLSGVLKKYETGTITLDSGSDASNSAKYNDSDDSELSEGSVYENECSSDSSVQTKTSAERRKKKKNTLEISRRSTRSSTVSNTQKSSNLIGPFWEGSVYNTRASDTTSHLKAQPLLRTPQRSVYSDCSTSSTPAPKRDVAVSTVTPNRGLILLSDSSLLSSVLPNKLLNDISPKNAQAASTPQKNMRIRLVPDKPLSDSPSFVELNLISPSKKPKIVDDDLEITSVTYIIPD